MTSVNERAERRLHEVFGEKGYASLSDGQKEAAMKVILWYEGGLREEADDKQAEVIDAIWYAAKNELGDMAYKLPTSCKSRGICDVRHAMWRLAEELLPIPQYKISRALGIKRNHATVFAGLNRANELVQYDPDFRKMYRRMSADVNAYLAGERDLQKSLH